MTELRLRAALLNSKHGLQLTRSDKKSLARTIRENDSNISERRIEEALGVPRTTISGWVQDIVARQKAEQEAVIYRLRALGWSQPEISKVVELDQSSISRKLCNLTKSSKLIKSLSDRGDSVAVVAEKLRIDLTLAWALALNDLVKDKLKFYMSEL